MSRVGTWAHAEFLTYIDLDQDPFTELFKLMIAKVAVVAIF